MGEMKMKDGNVLPSENSGAAAGTSENLTDGRAITLDKFEMVGKNIEKMESISRPSLTFWQEAWRRIRTNKAAYFSLILLIAYGLLYEKGMSLHEYLESAGGLSDRADKDNILVAKQNGEVGKVQNMGIAPGDRILVMPRFDSKNMQLAKDFTQILYQIAVATKVAVGL